MSRDDLLDSPSEEITTIEAERILRRSFRRKHPVFLWGPPGIGKSQLVAQIGEAYNEKPEETLVIDVRLALYDPNDLKGYPWVIDGPDGSKVMVWFPSEELPSEEDAKKYKTIILFLDELNGAPQQVQAAAYQLILDRRIGTYKLPDCCVMVAAGNRVSDRGVTYPMPSPLKNRLTHLFLTVDWAAWAAWACKNNCHPDVYGFLRYAQQMLYTFDPESDDTAFGTPRMWMQVSDILFDEDYQIPLGLPGAMSRREQVAEIGGKIGFGLANSFITHREIASELPFIEDILSGVTTIIDPKFNKHMSVLHSLSHNISDHLRAEAKGGIDAAFKRRLNNGLRFTFDNFKEELVMFNLTNLMTTNEKGAPPFSLKKVLENDVRSRFRSDYMKFLAMEED